MEQEKDTAEVKILKAQLEIYKKLYENKRAENTFRAYCTDQILSFLKMRFTRDGSKISVNLTEEEFNYIWTSLEDGHQHGRSFNDLIQENKMLLNMLALVE